MSTGESATFTLELRVCKLRVQAALFDFFAM